MSGNNQHHPSRRRPVSKPQGTTPESVYKHQVIGPPELLFWTFLGLIIEAVILILAFGIGGMPYPILAPQLDNPDVCFVTCIINPTGWQSAIIDIAVAVNIILLALVGTILIASREQRARYHAHNYLAYMSWDIAFISCFLCILYFGTPNTITGIIGRYAVKITALFMIGIFTIFFLMLIPCVYIFDDWRRRRKDKRLRRQNLEDEDRVIVNY